MERAERVAARREGSREGGRDKKFAPLGTSVLQTQTVGKTAGKGLGAA